MQIYNSQQQAEEKKKPTRGVARRMSQWNLQQDSIVSCVRPAKVKKKMLLWVFIAVIITLTFLNKLKTIRKITVFTTRGMNLK